MGYDTDYYSVNRAKIILKQYIFAVTESIYSILNIHEII